MPLQKIASTIDGLRQLFIRNVWIYSCYFFFTGTDHLIAVELFCVGCSDPRQGLQMSLWSEQISFLGSQHRHHHLFIGKNWKQCWNWHLIRLRALESDYDQTQVRSKRLWSDFSDQIDLWWDRTHTMVQTIKNMIRTSRQIDLWSDQTQTMVQNIKTMIRPFRPNWPLIRPRSHHGPAYCALEPLSRPCNFGLGTHGSALDWVWS